MNVQDLTISQARELAAMFEQKNTGPRDSCPWKIGSNYFIRTVTHHYTGKLIGVFPQELVLVDAAWIADDGRFADAIKNPKGCNEIEPYPDCAEVIIGRGSILDATVVGDIPRNQK